MKHSTFKRFVCLALAFCLILPYCMTGVHAAEEVTRIPHTQTEGDSNYFTFSETGWSAMGQSDEHVWSDDPSADPSAVWYTVNFVGHAIDIYAGKNWPMGYVAYYIDDEYVGEYNLYQSYNSNSLFITKIDGLDEGEHVFKAVATGKNGLTSGSTNDLIDCAEVYVYHEPYVAESITMEETTITMGEGGTKQLRYTVKPSYAELTDAVYTSSDEAVATVSSTGLITAVAAGTAVITLTASGLSAEVAVTVNPAVPGLAGSIVDIDSQWTQERYDEVKSLGTLSAGLTAWRNDIATSELALASVDSVLKNLTVTASDFVSGENTIPASAVTATFIRSTQAYNGGYTWNNYPTPNGSNRSESSDILWSTEPMDVAYNAVQPVWVEIAVPKNAAPGTYQGTLTVTADGLEEAMTFTYTLEVLDAVLPDATEFAKTFDVELWQYPYSSAEYYGVEPFSAEHLDILRSSMELYKSIGGHAITTTIMEDAWSGQTYSQNSIHYPSMIRWEKVNGIMTYDYTDFDAWVGLCKELGIGDKIVLYSIAPWHNTITYWENGVLKSEPNTFGNIVPDGMWTHFLTDLIAHLEEKGWFEDAYIGIDERGFSTAAFDLIDSIKGSNGEPLKTAGAMDGFVNKWDLALRVTDLNVGDTAVHDHPTEFAQLLKERQAKGYRTTLYSCTGHQPGNFSLCAPVESYWVILNAGKQGGAGFLRWAYDAWVADPLNDTTHSNFEAGDCFLIFPDEKDAADPVSRRSVRLARIAEGVRDVNKLMTIERNAPALAADVDAVYTTVTDLLGSYGVYTCPNVDVVAAEAANFKAALNALTERYILLLDGASTEVESVTITDGDSVKVVLGDTKQLSVEILPEKLLDNSLTWSSSDENVVTVADGLLTGVGQGTATVTAASVADPSKFDTIEVVVDIMTVDESKQESYYSFDSIDGASVIDGWAGYNATMKDGATVAAGMSGNALSVSTAGVGAIVENNRELTTDWSVAYWVKTTADFTDEISVLEDADQLYSLSMKLASNREQGGFRVGNNSGDVLTYKYTFSPDTWYHIAWVQDKDVGLSMYVNGTLVERNTWPVSNTVKSPIDVIGGTGFTGLIDEVKIYNAPLTEAEIAAVMVVDGVNLNAASVELNAGETFQIRATVVSSNADKSVTYQSADPAIATVSEKGLVTGVGRGETVITVTNPATGLSAELAVKVNKNVNIHNVLDRYVMPEKYLSTIERAPGTDRQYLGQPDMILTETGRLITAYPVGHGKGPLVMRISDDGGVSWTEKTDIPASWAGSQETPTLYTVTVNGNERLLLITACPGWGTDNDGNTTGWNVSYSDDDGNTWTEYEHFWSNFSNGNVNKVIVAMASLVQLKDENGNYIEKWMGVYHNYDMVNYKTYLTFDEAGNMQWSEPVPYLSEYRAIESGHQICEVGMFRSPDGSRIVALARSQSHMNLSTMFWSDDEGETWSEPIDLPGSLAGERHKAKYDPESGKLVITFREIQYDRDNDGLIESGDWYCGDWGLWVGTYEQLMNLEDGEYCVTIDEDFTQNTYSGDTGYAGYVILDDGTFVMNSYGHWDEDFSKSWTGGVTTDLCYIRQARFKLAELENVLFGDPCVDGHTEKVVPGTEPTFDAPGLTEGKVCELCGEVIVAQETIPALDYNEGIIPLDVLTVSCGDYEPDGGAAEGPAELAVDNDLNTIWHTDWYGTSRDNHWIQFELTEAYVVDGLRYKPRITGNTNGIITQYDIQVSNDGVNFTSVAAGNWAGDRNWKVVEFEGVQPKYVRLVALNALTDNAYVFACAAEIRLTGEKSAAHEHSFGEWTVTTPATCTEAGEETRTCECGETETRAIAALGHTEEILAAVEPTCTETGLTEGKKCSVCGEILVAQEVIPALGHDWSGLGCTRCDATRSNPFVDVEDDSYYIVPIMWALDEGITTGVNDTHFDPYGDCIRGQVVVFLWRAMGKPGHTIANPFVDVAESDFFYDAVLWAYEKGITTGVSSDHFDPYGQCNRAQVVTFLWRAMGKPESDTVVTFPDVPVGEFYYDAVAWAVEKGITTGLGDGTFGSLNVCNRTQVVTFLYRALA